jgi:hypothetical protein
MLNQTFRSALVALPLAVSLAVPAFADDSTPPPARPAHPIMLAVGVHSPITHLYEVLNAAVLHDAAVSNTRGTLAERPDTHVHQDAAPQEAKLSSLR